MRQSGHFLFEQDFRRPRVSEAAEKASLQEAEARGFARGLGEGRRQAQAENAAQLGACTQRLAEAAASLIADADAQRAALEEEAVALAVAVGRKLAGQALEAQPLASISEVARAAFQHLRAVPHLVVRVNEGFVDEVESLILRIARERGYDGRIVVLGEPEIAPGDARLEWADGGVVREQARVEEALAAAASAFTPFPPSGAIDQT